MSLLHRIGEGLAPYAVNKALDLPKGALEKLGKSFEKTGQTIRGNLPENAKILLVAKQYADFEERFDVRDLDFTVQYSALSKSILHNYSNCFLIVSGKEVGSIQKKPATLRSPLIRNPRPVNISIFLHGKKMGAIKYKPSLLRGTINVDYKGWTLTGSVAAPKFSLRCGDTIIASISQAIGYIEGYEITIFDRANELPVLLLVLAIDMASYHINIGVTRDPNAS